jgi:YesN/AraC family two-component response regulator
MERGAILVVDDDRAVRELVTLALGDAHRVQHAATADEALVTLNREPVAAVILDYYLPDRTGLEVLTDIRFLRPSIPIIMISGHGSERICAAAFKLGVVDYFPKPLDLFELVDRVKGVLPQRQQERPAHSDVDSCVDQPPAWRGPFAKRPDMSVQRAVTVIRHHYSDTVSLGHVAREVGISGCRLSRRFTQVMGLSFREYLLLVRLERAKELLASGHASITEIALAVGFGDLPRFDKLFKRYTHLTPSSYRSRSSHRKK